MTALLDSDEKRIQSISAESEEIEEKTRVQFLAIVKEINDLRAGA